MAGSGREEKLIEAFVALIDTPVDTYDVIDLLHTLLEECTELLPVDAGGILLLDATGELQPVSSTSEKIERVEVMQLDAGSGPCVDAFNTGEPVVVQNIAETGARWPEFRLAALSSGFHSVHAVPMRLRGETIGAMNLFNRRPGRLTERDAALAQALAATATIGILQERNVRESSGVTAQLQRALDSRIIIEQAKGVLAASGTIGVDEAFSAMRAHARNTNTSIRTVAAQIVERTLEIDAFGPSRLRSTPAGGRGDTGDSQTEGGEIGKLQA